MHLMQLCRSLWASKIMRWLPEKRIDRAKVSLVPHDGVVTPCGGHADVANGKLVIEKLLQSCDTSTLSILTLSVNRRRTVE